MNLSITDGKSTKAQCEEQGFHSPGEALRELLCWYIFINMHHNGENFKLNMKGSMTERFNHTLQQNVLTSPAVSHGHFTHSGLSDGWTGYCVLGWFLYNVPRSGLQTPLIATGFVSPGAGSPFAPLTHLTALCTGTQRHGCEMKPQNCAKSL